LKFNSSCLSKLWVVLSAECTSSSMDLNISLRLCSPISYFIEPAYKPCRNHHRLISTNNLEALQFCFQLCLFRWRREPFRVLDILVQLYPRLSNHSIRLLRLWCTFSYPWVVLHILVLQESTILHRHFFYVNHYYSYSKLYSFIYWYPFICYITSFDFLMCLYLLLGEFFWVTVLSLWFKARFSF
jgi:hypothetical protein